MMPVLPNARPKSVARQSFETPVDVVESRPSIPDTHAPIIPAAPACRRPGSHDSMEPIRRTRFRRVEMEARMRITRCSVLGPGSDRSWRSSVGRAASVVPAEHAIALPSRMPPPRRRSNRHLSVQRARSLLFACVAFAFVLIAAPAFVTGCSSRPGPPIPAEGAFDRWPITIDSSGQQHLLQTQVGSPGYTFEMDSTWDAYRARHVFVTIRRPDPRFAYPQVIVDLRLLTPVDSKTPIRVFAREVEFADRENEAEYRPAAEAPTAQEARR
jgi:hypothetical protein